MHALISYIDILKIQLNEISLTHSLLRINNIDIEWLAFTAQTSCITLICGALLSTLDKVSDISVHSLLFVKISMQLNSQKNLLLMLNSQWQVSHSYLKCCCLKTIYWSIIFSFSSTKCEKPKGYRKKPDKHHSAVG